MVGGRERKEEKGVLAGTHLDGLRVCIETRLEFTVHFAFGGTWQQHVIDHVAMYQWMQFLFSSQTENAKWEIANPLNLRFLAETASVCQREKNKIQIPPTTLRPQQNCSGATRSFHQKKRMQKMVGKVENSVGMAHLYTVTWVPCACTAHSARASLYDQTFSTFTYQFLKRVPW